MRIKICNEVTQESAIQQKKQFQEARTDTRCELCLKQKMKWVYIKVVISSDSMVSVFIIA